MPAPAADGMVKHAILSGKDASGYPWIHRFEPGTGHGLRETAFIKHAGVMYDHLPGVRRLVESLRPKPDTLYLLNASLVAGEYTGFNARGDWFNKSGLLHTPPGWDDVPVEDVERRRTLALHTEPVHYNGRAWGALSWGYPTWMNAHRYRHHVNTGPEHAYGLVLGAFWDERMQRVILVTELLKSWCIQRGALSVYTRIEAGEFCDTSMGCKVPFDECSICGHMARTPMEYCRHTNGSDPRYGMKKLLSDGRRVGVYNRFPRGFDDSFVFVGAEKAAKVMADLTSAMKGTRDYSRTLPAGASGGAMAGMLPPVPSPTSSRAPAPPMTRSASFYDAGMVDTMSVGGGGPLVYLPMGVEQWEASPSASSLVADSAREAFEGTPWTGERRDRFSRMLNGLPGDDARTRASKTYLLQRLKKLEEQRKGMLSPQSLHDWEALEKERLRRTWDLVTSDIAGVEARMLQDLEAAERADNAKRGRLDEAVERALEAQRLTAGLSTSKTVKSAAAEGAFPAQKAVKIAMLRKRAEMLKRLPSPRPGEMLRARDMCAQMPDLPDGVLGRLSQYGSMGLRGMARMGVILRPHEYGHVLRSALSRARLPEPPWRQSPLDEEDGEDPLVDEMFPSEEQPALFSARDPVPPSIVSLLRDILSPYMVRRSVAPQAIIIRVHAPASPLPAQVRRESAKLGSALPPGYADYRAGIVADSATMRYGWGETGWPLSPGQAGSSEEHTALLLCRLFE